MGCAGGSALSIFQGAGRVFLGLRWGPAPADFVGKWHAIGAHLDTIDPWALLVGLTALAIIVGWPLVNRRGAGPVVGVVPPPPPGGVPHLPAGAGRPPRRGIKPGPPAPRPPPA